MIIITIVENVQVMLVLISIHIHLAGSKFAIISVKMSDCKISVHVELGPTMVCISRLYFVPVKS